MSLLFLQYPACSTCRKAKAWLDNNKTEYTDRHMKDQNPSADELKTWHAKSGLPLKKFFNTSGMLYTTLFRSSEEEQIKLLASDGMLVKRPLLIGDDFVLVGFKEDQWKEVLNQ